MAYDRDDRRPNRKGRKRVCSFCVEKVENIDYKDTQRLRKYVSERSKILPRRVTGTCAFKTNSARAGQHRPRPAPLPPSRSA